MATEIKVNNKVKELAEEYATEINYYKEQFLNDIIEIEADNKFTDKFCTAQDLVDLITSSPAWSAGIESLKSKLKKLREED